MTTSLWLAAGLACAQLGPASALAPAENVAAPRSSESKIRAVTVYQGQALVTREVSVPDGVGNVELVVTPLPAQTVEGSLFAEGAEGLRVLSTRFRSRAVENDTRGEVRAKEEALRKLEADSLKIKKEIDVHVEDLHYLQGLEGFTGKSLTALTQKGRLDSQAVIDLSEFLMENRGAKSKAETDLRERLKANAEAVEFTKRQLAELSSGSNRFERDAIIVVNRTKPGAGVVRLGYLVGSASWSPQYRLRGGADDAAVRLEYLAVVTQQTGEDWPDVRVTLSTAQPSLDAAPPELLPLKMMVAGAADAGPIETNDAGSRAITAALEQLLLMPFAKETKLEDVLKYVHDNTKSPAFPDGVPIYVDPAGLSEAEKTPASVVSIDLAHVPLRSSLKLLLDQLNLTYRVGDGVLKIVYPDEVANGDETESVPGRFGTGMGRDGPASLNQAAATDQAEELRVSDESGAATAAAAAAAKNGPSVVFHVAGRIDIPSRRDPQLLEVARVELPAEYYAKAVPVLTPRVYRLAKLTNKSEFVLLPGETTVYVSGDFVGRMKMPLVAAGEPFVAGFGVDPQVQVTRRLIRKTRALQGGNQIFTYEFRIGLRNYRPGPVNVQLWDRLPKPEGESVAVNLVKTSADLSTDALYLRAARMDNLLLWDLKVPPGTVGAKSFDLNYEFRLEYARDLPRPRFVAGGLREGPIGGGAMGGMGGMGAGFH